MRASKNTSICLPADLYKKVKARAKAEGFETSLSAFFVRLIRQDLARSEEAKEQGK